MRFSRDQLDMLERKYWTHQYLALPERAELAYEIGVAEWNVKMWFQNRRTKDKRRAKEAKQLLSQHNAVTGVTFAVPQQPVAAAAPSAAAASSTVRATKCANRFGKGKGRRRAVTARTKTTRQAAGGKRKSRRGTLRTKAMAADAAK